MISKQILEQLVSNLREAMGLQAVVSRINDDPDFRALFDQTYEAHGLNTIYDGLLKQLTIVLARIWDASDPASGRGADRASLYHLMALLDDKALIREFIDEARSWTPQIPRLEDKNANTAARAIQRARVRFRRLTTREPGTAWLDTLQTFRNRHVAHTLFNMGEEESLRYGYIGDLLSATCAIIEPLRLGIEGTDWGVEEFRREYQNQADAIITLLGKGMELHGSTRQRPQNE